MPNGQTRQNIKPGLEVDIVLKKDQPTGKLTRGVVADILTSSKEHHRGIKVRLTNGQVGRVQNIVGTSAPASVKAAPVPTPGLMRIDIWADVVCPFCYIGEHQFKKALAQFENKNKVKIIYHSYELNPASPKDFKGNLDEFLAKQRGVSVAEAKEMNKDVAEYAAKVGLAFKLDIVKPANSFDAHRLLQLAKKHKLGREMMDRLHAAYFCEGKDIGDRGALLQLAVEVGIDAKAVEAVFATTDFTDEVRADEAAAERMGVDGVPFFLFNSKYSVTGAQTAEAFLEGLRKAWGQ